MSKRIKRLRKRLGNITQSELARMIRVNQATISRLENGAPLGGPILTAVEALEKQASRGAESA
jgi:predicted transcriptional regulator